jgi:hypothetical protein
MIRCAVTNAATPASHWASSCKFVRPALNCIGFWVKYLRRYLMITQRGQPGQHSGTTPPTTPPRGCSSSQPNNRKIIQRGRGLGQHGGGLHPTHYPAPERLQLLAAPNNRNRNREPQSRSRMIGELMVRRSVGPMDRWSAAALVDGPSLWWTNGPSR